jgi:hypothetical protein
MTFSSGKRGRQGGLDQRAVDICPIGGTLAVHLPRGMDIAIAQPCNLRGQPTGSPVIAGVGEA